MKSLITNMIACLATAVLFSGVAAADRTPAPANAYLYIGWPNDGEVVPANRPFRVWFGLRNMGVAPKGACVPNTGHHHLLIDADLPPLDQEIPSDRNHIHFGAGQTLLLGLGKIGSHHRLDRLGPDGGRARSRPDQ